MTVVLRFAPSPTGRIHIGNLRTAMLNWLYARKMGGEFILRLDDTDAQRSTQAFAEGIRDDLKWIGLDWDRSFRQSERFARYEAVVADLKAKGRLYACYESEDELDRKRKRQRARGLPPVYDRAGLKLSDAERQAFVDEGRQPHWRFLLDPEAAGGEAGGGARTGAKTIEWTDLVRGEQKIDLASLSDPVLIRADGSYLYTLCSVIDDMDEGVTHIMRGEDHVTNSAVQVEIFETLGGTAPAFAHHSLLIGADGQGLSKRLGSLSVEGFRETGLEPLAVAAHAALIGTSDPVQPHLALSELADLFEFSKLSRAPGRFDIEELKLLNAKLLHMMPLHMAAAGLSAQGLPTDDPKMPAFWQAVRGNLEVMRDARNWWDVVAGEVAGVIEDADFCAKAADLLPPAPWDETTWGAWTKAVKDETGAKGHALFHPLRLALTGQDKGPELKLLLPLIGREKALARLAGVSG